MVSITEMTNPPSATATKPQLQPSDFLFGSAETTATPTNTEPRSKLIKDSVKSLIALNPPPPPQPPPPSHARDTKPEETYFFTDPKPDSKTDPNHPPFESTATPTVSQSLSRSFSSNRSSMDWYGSSQRPYEGDRSMEIVSGMGFNVGSNQIYATGCNSPDWPPVPPRATLPSHGAPKPWGFDDSEMKRKKRIAKYKVYTVEGKVKASLKKGIRWIKNKCSQIVHGY